MTIIEVAQELQKDGTKRFRREKYKDSDWCVTVDLGDIVACYGNENYPDENPTIEDLLATDWEEVK